MNIKLQQLRYFLFVTEEGGFRAASHRVNRSQAAISTAIKELERILGHPLFEAGNKAQLTAFGEICLPKIKRFLTLYTELDNDLKAAAAGQQGRVKIASVPSVAAKLIPSILGVFSEMYPKVQVSLIDDNAAGVETKLLSGDVDIAIGNYTSLNRSQVEFTSLLSDPIGVVCLKTNPLVQNISGLSWTALINEPFIHNGTCILLEHTPAYQLNKNALYSIKNITSLFSVLELGIGITTLPKLAFPSNESPLTWIPLIDPPLKRNIDIFKISDRTISPQAQAFYDLCIEFLSKNTMPETQIKNNT